MNKEDQEYRALANSKLISQVAEYYRRTRCDLEVYQEMNFTVLENVATEHLMHWRKELHELIFDGMNCHDRRTE